MRLTLASPICAISSNSPSAMRGEALSALIRAARRKERGSVGMNCHHVKLSSHSPKPRRVQAGANRIIVSHYTTAEARSLAVMQYGGHKSSRRDLTQGRINCWHRTPKSSILLENHFLPGDLKAQIAVFVENYNHRRCHDSINNLRSADV